MAALTYFAADGSYGDAHGLIILDTRGWGQTDWDKVEMSSDRERIIVALENSVENGDI